MNTVDDNDEYINTPNAASQYDARKERRMVRQGTSLRRRPFLIFDKIQPKGYKIVKKAAIKVPPPSQYRPGDGFSGREAKPIGVNLLTRNRKQFVAGPPIGVLDLTQSAPHVNQKRSFQGRDRDDNSFAPVPKTKKSRHSKSKPTDEDIRPPSHPAPPAARRTQMNNVVLREISGNTRAKFVPHKMDELRVKKSHSGTDAQTKGILPRKNLSQDTFVNNTHAGPHGTDTVDKSGCIRETSTQHALSTAEHRDTPEEGHDSWPTHISDTPPRQLRAKSVPLESPGRQYPSQPSERVFRRFSTQ
ncbi:hypothetical protein MFIFM68171_09313 [Madurella fahalii]|uniref:Uncharacterized protein n=1 Tax=Madurella fahalii TaxID=1157608 RepID=A0ABQ0GMW3_9PEZI